MGESELKIALQREGEERIRGFWLEAEANVSAERTAIEAEREELHDKAGQQLQAEIALLRSTLLFASQARARECRLHAETDLEQRLMVLARQLLPELTGKDREALWLALREELPSAEWALFTVHPADRELAMREFPTATIECDETIGGGLIATSADAVIRVDNSLSCRLLRAWPDLLPKLLAEPRILVNDNETTDTGKTV